MLGARECVDALDCRANDQLCIVFERTDHLPLLGRADCRDSWCLSIAIAIDEVAVVLSEASTIDASLSR